MCLSAVTQFVDWKKKLSKVAIWTDFFLKVRRFCKLELAIAIWLN